MDKVGRGKQRVITPLCRRPEQDLRATHTLFNCIGTGIWVSSIGLAGYCFGRGVEIASSATSDSTNSR